jgi:hypothetical protein
MAGNSAADTVAAAPGSERPQADRDQSGHQRHVERVAGLQADHGGGEQRRDQDRKRRDLQIAGGGQDDELAHAQDDEHRGKELEDAVGREPHHADGERDQRSAAQDAGHDCVTWRRAPPATA